MSRRGSRLYHTVGNRDKNERIIIEALEARGFSVNQIQGKGFPDLVVSKHGTAWFVEIKQPKKGYTAAQIEWRAKWLGPEPRTLRTVEDAMKFPDCEATR